jgi:pantothenate kinase-related protein Tda10
MNISDIHILHANLDRCQWFQKVLANFAQSDSMVMAVTGKEGSGKTVLAASTVERLQRSLGRTSFATLFYSISKQDTLLPPTW